MPCEVISTPEGTAIVCSRGGSRRRCADCGGPVVALCDAPIEPVAFGRSVRTCDAPMCARHRTPVGPNLDHCPAHAGVPA